MNNLPIYLLQAEKLRLESVFEGCSLILKDVLAAESAKMNAQ